MKSISCFMCATIALVAIALVLCFIPPTLAAAPTAKKPAAIIAGYPAPDAPMFEFGFRRQGVKVESFDKVWVSPDEYSKYSTIVLTGSLKRGQVTPSAFSGNDTSKLQQFFQGGGTLIVAHSGMAIFDSPEGKAFLESIQGKLPIEKRDVAAANNAVQVMQPSHPWIKHLSAIDDLSWFTGAMSPMRTMNGEKIIGNDAGRMSLGRFKIGSGQLIYMGWEMNRFMPHGRNLKSELQDEEQYEAQYRIFLNIVAELYPATPAQ